MCNVKVFTNMSNAKVVILVWNTLELISFLHHDVGPLLKR
jgi:hypothetical protein